MRVIAVTLTKGGVGKSTTAVNLATALHLKKKRVLLIDLAPEASASHFLGFKKDGDYKTVADLLRDPELSPRDVIQKTPFGLDVIPSHPSLADMENGMGPDKIGLIKTIFEPLSDDYDFVIMDTHPSTGFLTIASYFFATEALIPVEAQPEAVETIAETIKRLNNTKSLNQNFTTIRIVPTKLQARTVVGQISLDFLKKNYADLLLPVCIDYHIAFAEAPVTGMPLVVSDPSHPGAESYMKLATEIMK